VLVGIDAVKVMAAYQRAVNRTGLLPEDGWCVNRNMSEQVL